MPPTIPFWLGEAPRPQRGTVASGFAAARRRRRATAKRRGPPSASSPGWSRASASRSPPPSNSPNISPPSHAALGCLPTQDNIVLERFFDEAGGMQLVIHSPYGGRINRAWGLALRKRFCRKFNFELQAAATEDNIILSLTTAHSFELIEAVRYLHSASARGVLTQALFDAPMFAARWRWAAGIALALPRMRGGKRVPPQFARMEAEDLVGSVFPDQIACLENIVGEREVPDHPLVNQTLARLSERGDGHRGAGATAAATRGRRGDRRRARSDRTLAARAGSAFGQALRVSRRRAVGGAPRAGGGRAALVGDPRRRRISAGSIPRRSPACGPRRGPSPATPTNCTTRCRGSGS